MKNLGNKHYIPETGYELVSKKDNNIRSKSLWLSTKDSIGNYFEELEKVEEENQENQGMTL